MESSYCYLYNKSEPTGSSSSGSPSKLNADDIVDSTNEEDNESSSKLESSSESSSKSNIEDFNMNEIKALKKNLNNEEEFRSINHSEPIHIFLKIKPLSFQESAKQKNEVFIFKFSLLF